MLTSSQADVLVEFFLVISRYSSIGNVEILTSSQTDDVLAKFFCWYSSMGNIEILASSNADNVLINNGSVAVNQNF